MIKVNRENVIKAYRMYLGRLPESEDAIMEMLMLDSSQLKRALLGSSEHKHRAHESNIDIFILGNCQAAAYARIIETMTSLRCTSIELTSQKKEEILSGELFIAHILSNAKLVCVVNGYSSFAEELIAHFDIPSERLRLLPNIIITMFHPDMVYLRAKSGQLIGDYNSRIAAFSFILGLSPSEALAAYNERTFNLLAYYDADSTDRRYIGREAMLAKLPLSPILERWISKKECFMHSINHPKFQFLVDIARAFLAKENIKHDSQKGEYIFDIHSNGASWCPYPEIALRHGFESDYYFKLKSFNSLHDITFLEFDKRQRLGYGLDRFIELQYRQFSDARPDEAKFSIVEAERFRKFSELYKGRGSCSSSERNVLSDTAKESVLNPYKGLADYQFWRRSVSSLPIEQVDPVTNPRFNIAKEDKVSTAGSCFAQHISRALSQKRIQLLHYGGFFRAGCIGEKLSCLFGEIRKYLLVKAVVAAFRPCI